MGDEHSWMDTLLAILEHPEKGALFLVILAGAWRWLRELFREHKEDEQHDIFIDRLLKDDKTLRAENARLRLENERLLQQLQDKGIDDT